MKTRTITGRDPLSGQSLCIQIDGDRIHSIATGAATETAWIASGLIDLQVNGYGGCDLNAGTVDVDSVLSLVDKLAATGVTTFIPTLITTSEASILDALRSIAEARKVSNRAAHAIPFVHLEGPFLSPEDGPRGAHPREEVRPPSLTEFERWQAACGGLVGMVTLSPHWEHAVEFIAALTARGIIVAIGHTHASAEEIHAAAVAGASLSTHLGNGIAQMLRRHPNPIWAQLADDRLVAAFIADGHHLPADTLKAMLRAKKPAKSILVSDTVALGGMQPGFYHSTIGGDVELRADGSLRIAGTDYMAGAALPLKEGIAYCASSGICPLGEAVMMATENPGRLTGGRGVLRPGAGADLIRFTIDPEKKRMNILDVLIKGTNQL